MNTELLEIMKMDIKRCEESQNSNEGTYRLYQALIAKYNGIFEGFEKDIPTSGKAAFGGGEFNYRPELNAIKEKFTTRVQYYCNIMGVSVNRISIKDQKTRWGSCSSKGNVNFNYKLYYMPQALMDYVIVHELSHRKYMNHSDLFWNEVGKYCPEYRMYRKELTKYL